MESEIDAHRGSRADAVARLEDYYRNHHDEARRLDADGSANVERARTLDILARYLPPRPAVVLDIGGGTGAYAFPLATAGYEVHLVDRVEYHIEQVRVSCAEVPLASCLLGDARAIEFPNQSADAVLLLGPLYHLPDRADRLRCLNEVHRVLRPGGILFAAAVCRFAALIDGIERDFINDGTYIEILAGDLRDGHHNPNADPRYFTDTFCHLPEELRAEVTEAGFFVNAIIGIEGPIWTSDRMPGWAEPERRTVIMDLLRGVEEEPSLLGSSSHLMAVATPDLGRC